MNYFSEYVAYVWRAPPQLSLGDRDIIHAAMGLSGEAGEVLELVKKFAFTPERLAAKGLNFDEEMAKELADVYFYLVRLCAIFGLQQHTLEGYLREKLDKRWKEGDHGHG